MQHNYETLQIEARNLKMMWDRVERQFTAEAFDRKQAERSYDWREAAVEQFMLAATQAGMFPPITGPEESELKAAAELRPMKKEN
jgi:hypothetical protein